MIGRQLWSEFFSNRDWPLASAVAVLLLLILVVPIVIYRDVDPPPCDAPMTGSATDRRLSVST